MQMWKTDSHSKVAQKSSDVLPPFVVTLYDILYLDRMKQKYERKKTQPQALQHVGSHIFKKRGENLHFLYKKLTKYKLISQ